MIQKFEKFYNRIIYWGSAFQSPFLLAIRLFWGWQFFVTGKGKLMDMPRVVDFFTSIHIPFPLANAYLAGSAECFGGLLLLAGLGARLAAIPLIFTMIIAYLTAHREAVITIFSDPDTFLEQHPFLFLLASLIILIFGPGKFSIDALIKKARS